MTEDEADKLMRMTRITLLQCMGAYKPRTRKRAALKRILSEFYPREEWWPDEQPTIPAGIAALMMKMKSAETKGQQ